jgi:hypothetical protein
LWSTTRGARARTALSKQEIIAEIRKLHKKLGRIPTLKDLVRLTGVSRFAITVRFGCTRTRWWSAGCTSPGNKLSVDELFDDWAAVARKLGKAPTSENGVMFLFGTLARELGFMMIRIGDPCPAIFSRPLRRPERAPLYSTPSLTLSRLG